MKYFIVIVKDEYVSKFENEMKKNSQIENYFETTETHAWKEF